MLISTIARVFKQCRCQNIDQYTFYEDNFTKERFDSNYKEQNKNSQVLFDFFTLLIVFQFNTCPFFICSNEKNYNPNFQEIKGDWRERLKRKTAT